MAAHRQQHAISSTTDHSAGTNGTLIGTESGAVVEKAFGTAATAGNIAQRDGAGDVLVPTTPSSATAAASKAYVDATKQGLDTKDSVRLATAAALPAYTRSGNVITASANGALTVDGVAAATGNRVLVKDGAAGSDNGIYDVTDPGGAGAPYVLTRSSDADASADVTAGLYVFVSEGTANGDTGWVLTTNDPITLNTTALSFTQFTGAGQVTAGDGLDKSANTLSVAPAVATAEQQYGGLVATRTADGSGAAGADAGYVAVKTDNSDLAVGTSNELKIKSGSRLDKVRASATYAGTQPTAAEMAAVLTAQFDHAIFYKASAAAFLCFRIAVTGGDPASDFRGVELTSF